MGRRWRWRRWLLVGYIVKAFRRERESLCIIIFYSSEACSIFIQLSNFRWVLSSIKDKKFDRTREQTRKNHIARKKNKRENASKQPSRVLHSHRKTHSHTPCTQPLPARARLPLYARGTSLPLAKRKISRGENKIKKIVWLTSSFWDPPRDASETNLFFSFPVSRLFWWSRSSPTNPIFDESLGSASDRDRSIFRSKIAGEKEEEEERERESEAWRRPRGGDERRLFFWLKILDFFDVSN